MKNVAILCLLAVTLFPTFVFSQQTGAFVSALSHDSDNEILKKEYYEESRKLSQEFTPLNKQLRKKVLITIDGKTIHDYFQYDREYCQPLFERSKQIMRRLTGCNDYLSMWENGYMQKIIAATEELLQNKQYSVIEETTVPYLGVMDHDTILDGGITLLTLYTLAIVNEQRDEILRDSIYENSEGAAILRERQPKERVSNPWWFSNKEYREKHKNSGIWFDFPPRELTVDGATTFESSWHAMAIYSFKNERSENILYEIVNDPASEPKLADWAVYYLALSPNSARFLPKVEKDLQEKIASLQKEFPQKGSALSDLDGATRKPYLNNFRSLFKSASDRYYSVAILGNPEKPGENVIQRYLALNLIRRLRILKQSLEFNEKVPENEKERFEIVRREFAISWALTPKHTIIGPVVCAGLKKGEERFRIYMAEYEPPLRGELWRYPVFYLRDADSSHPQDQWDAKAFYERELARKDYYSEVQIEYIQKQLEIIDKNEKQRIIMEQREREKNGNN